MAESSQVCWRSVKSWTKVIGWIEIVNSILMIIESIKFILVGPTKYQEIIENFDHPYLALVKSYGFGFMVVILVTGLVMSLVHLGMGIILLKAVNERNALYVKAWLIYMVIYLCNKLVTKCILFNMTTDGTAHQEISEMLRLLVFVMFMFWVVWKFKKELEMENMGGKRAAYKS